jgi:ankyrin repeat protein
MDDTFLRACRNRHILQAKALLKREDADLNCRDELGKTALHYLIDDDDIEMITEVVGAGADVNIPDNNAETPLHIAAAKGSNAIMAMLLEAGADINAQDKEDKTPLVYAISGGMVNAAEYLINKGADKYARAAYGLSARDFAKAEGLTQLLPLFESNSLTIDSQGNNPLHHAVYQNGAAMVRNLVKADRSGINDRNSKGITPLLAAVSNLNFAIAEILLKFGADPNLSLPLDGKAPLHIAAENGITLLGNVLLDNNANINALDQNGATPLSLSIQGQHCDFAIMLVRRGASASIADNSGKYPLDYAKELELTALVEMLASRMK